MSREFLSPEQRLLNWLGDQPRWLKVALCRRLIFVVASHSADFVLTGDEAVAEVARMLSAVDLPLRRVGRILIARDLFTFFLDSATPEFLMGQRDEYSQRDLGDFDLAVYLRSCSQWTHLCRIELANDSCKSWLAELESA